MRKIAGILILNNVDDIGDQQGGEQIKQSTDFIYWVLGNRAVM